MLLLVEFVPPEQAHITISLVLTFTVNILERIQIRFSFLCFKSWWVYFEIDLATLCYISVVFYFMSAIIFNVFGPMHTTHKHCIVLFPTVHIHYSISEFMFVL